MSKYLKRPVFIFVALVTAASIVGIVKSVNDYFEQVKAAHPVYRSMKLVDCTNTSLEATITVPKCLALDLIMATPGLATNSPNLGHDNSRPPFNFSGQVKILEGDLAKYEFEINSETAIECNWLFAEHNIPVAWDLTGHLYESNQLGWPGLVKVLKPESHYQIRIAFSDLPLTNASLFLYVLQRYGDSPDYKRGSLKQ